MYKAAIFDLDGTIADTLESIAIATNKTLEACGYQAIDIEQYKYFAGDGADTLIRRALIAAGDEKQNNFEKAYEIYKGIFEIDCTYKVTVFDGIKETLQQMKQKGMKLAVVTNKPHLRAVTVVEYLFGKNYFDEIIGQQEGMPKKPDPTSVLLVAKRMQVPVEQCVYVGDTNVDMQTGNRAGMYTVGVLWGFRERKELEENGACQIVERPEELLEID